MQSKDFKTIFFLILLTFNSKSFGQLEGICDNVPDVVTFLPYPNDCTKYILCILWYPSVIECGQGTIFNEESIICEPGDQETCQLFVTTTTIISSTTGTTTDSEELDSTTTSLNDSTKGSASSVYSTSLSETTADEISTTSATSTTLRPITTTTVRTPSHRCPPGGTGYIPHYINCSRYFECIKGIRHLRFCPDGLLFDSITLQCTYPELAVCAGNKE